MHLQLYELANVPANNTVVSGYNCAIGGADENNNGLSLYFINVLVLVDWVVTVGEPIN